MNRIEEYLGNLHSTLSAKSTVRNLIVLECASDLVELYNVKLGNGYSKEKAAESAIELMGISDKTAIDLSHVHNGRVLNAISGFSSKKLLWSTFSLALLVLLLLAVSWNSGKILTDAGYFLYPQLVLLVIPLAMFFKNSYQLHAESRPAGATRQKNIRRVREFGVALLLFSYLATGLKLLLTYTGTLDNPTALPLELIHWLMSSAALLSIGLVSASVCGLAWFVNLMQLIKSTATSAKFETNLQTILKEMQ